MAPAYARRYARGMPLSTASAPSEVRISHCLLGPDGEEQSVSADPGPTEPFYAASTIKLHVVLTAVRAAERGRIALDQCLPASRTVLGHAGAEVTLSGDHLTRSEPAEGDLIPISALIEKAITVSSNTATNQLIGLVGLPAIADVIGELGLVSTKVERLIGDEHALAAGLTNETSAWDLARTLHAILTEPGEGAHIIRQALADQQIPIILRAAAEHVTGGSKSGWVDGYRHDVAYLHGTGDTGHRQILAVMTAGLSKDEADERIIGLARELMGDVTA